MGPVVTRTRFDTIRKLIYSSIEEGVTLLLAGGAKCPDGREIGFYIRPAMFADVTPDMRIWRKKIFGPVVRMLGDESEDEAVHLANDTVYSYRILSAVRSRYALGLSNTPERRDRLAPIGAIRAGLSASMRRTRSTLSLPERKRRSTRRRAVEQRWRSRMPVRSRSTVAGRSSRCIYQALSRKP